MTEYKTVGLDLAKRKFHLVALDPTGKKVLTHKCMRDELLPHILSTYTKNTLIAMEACGGANYWARTLQKHGFPIVLLKPNEVKAYAKVRQKNDTNDALAIAKTALDPDMRTVQPKSLEIQELRLIHKLRATTIRDRVQKTNALMAHLHEFGYVCEETKGTFARNAQAVIQKAYEQDIFSVSTKDLFLEEAKAIQALLDHEKSLDKKIKDMNATNEKSIILQTIPGVGPLIGSILSTLPYEAHGQARELSASLGLVPSQHTTGGTVKLGRISKRGDGYVRRLLIQGARCILMGASKARGTQDPMVTWAYRLWKRKGFNVACVALANKLARISYACVRDSQIYTLPSVPGKRA